jgi:hypothetical protein
MAWMEDGYMTDLLCLEVRHVHLFNLLGWRYFRPSVPRDDFSSSDEEGNNLLNIRGFGQSPSDIDRAIWPVGFKHIENTMLMYKQPPNNA